MGWTKRRTGLFGEGETTPPERREKKKRWARIAFVYHVGSFMPVYFSPFREDQPHFGVQAKVEEKYKGRKKSLNDYLDYLKKTY